MLRQGNTAAGDPERAIALREIRAEADRLLPQYFTQCGEDHFSHVLEHDELRFFKPNRPLLYRLEQYKGLRVEISVFMPSSAEKLNGQDWKALVTYEARAGRDYERLYREAVGRPPGFDVSSGLAQWSPWGDWGYGFVIELRKKHGRIMMENAPSPGSPPSRRAIACAMLPR